MTIWKITTHGPKKVKETRFKEEKLLEEHVEDWIAGDPSLLGEPLLMIGRQVIVPDTKDRLDLLALDPQGSTVIIELKRGQLKDPVDTQALRYASYISKWSFADLEDVARNFMGKVGDPEFNFNAIFESFCEESGAGEVPDLNEEQRIIIVGSSVRDRLGSVALWLREHNVDIKLIELRAYKDGDSFLIEPQVIVPVPTGRFTSVGKIAAGAAPWVSEGMIWHLEKRCSPVTRACFAQLEKIVCENLDVDGPRWNQKFYVAFRVNNYIWMRVRTKQSVLVIDVHVKTGTFAEEELAADLGLARYDRDDPLSEKLGLPSSVMVRNQREKVDRVSVRVKEDFDLTSESFLRFLKAAHRACPK